MGVMRMPARAPIAADSPKDSARTKLVSTPTSRAASRCRGGQHRLAQQRAFQEQEQPAEDEQRTAQDPEALRQDGGAQHHDGVIAREAGQLMETLVEDDLRDAAKEDAGAYRDDDEGDGGGTARGLDRQAVQREADQHRDRDGEQGCERQGDAGGGGEDRHHAAQHDEFALREVHDIGGVVDQREAQRHQRIDRADGEAGDEELQQFWHLVSLGR